MTENIAFSKVGIVSPFPPPRATDDIFLFLINPKFGWKWNTEILNNVVTEQILGFS
jgi:hypothetical protein